METPIGFLPLREAADAAGRKLFGRKWRPLAAVSSDAIICKLDPEIDRVIMLVAERCEAGEILAAYRSVTGADSLERSVWLMPHWRNFFATGTIDLDLPLLDDKLRPTADGSALCRREIFLKRHDVDRFLAALPRPRLLIRSKLRYPSDEALIQEALEAIADGRARGPLRAAKLVCAKAEGQGATALDRLRKLIAEELNARTSPRIAKTSPVR